MRIIAIIIPLMWGTLIFGHGEEKHEPKIIEDHKMDNTSQKLIPDEGEHLNSLNDKKNNRILNFDINSNAQDLIWAFYYLRNFYNNYRFYIKKYP